jgi:hypothetical protein
MHLKAKRRGFPFNTFIESDRQITGDADAELQVQVHAKGRVFQSIQCLLPETNINAGTFLPAK